jgi:hypothetical protein
MDYDTFAIFKSVHWVLKAEKILKKAGVPVESVPVPRRISADCGVALSFPSKFTEKVRKSLANSNASPNALYRKTAENTFIRL